MFYYWLAVVIVLGIVEAVTVNLVSIWFVASGILAIVVSFFTDSFIIQFGVFVIVGVILMLLTKDSLNKLLKKNNNEKLNLDRIIGAKGIVTESIYKNKIGEVKVDGKKWSSISNKEILEGSFVRILEIDGVKLKVEEWSDE